MTDGTLRSSGRHDRTFDHIQDPDVQGGPNDPLRT